MKNTAKTLLFLSIVALLSACNSSAVTLSNLSSKGQDVRHTEAQLTYLNSDNYLDTTPYNGNMSVSAPNPVVLSWEASGNAKSYKVNIYKDADLSDLVVSYTSNEKSLDFYNSELGTTYYWNVSSGNVTSESATFTTDSKGPRNLYVEGVENFRDLGGYGNIKQGLIYRSGRFNEDKEDIKVSITDKGLFEINNVLNIKTEIDLRRTSTNEVGGLTDKSVLGDGVNYIQLPMYYGGNNILTFTGKASGDDFTYDNPAKIKSFFEILADANNYPVNFHCSIGKDRTGCLAFLIEALLGNSEEQLFRDYMFTNFANAGMCKSTDLSTKYFKTLSDYEDGDTFQEKTYNYLHTVIGITEENLNSVIALLKAE